MPPPPFLSIPAAVPFRQIKTNVKLLCLLTFSIQSTSDPSQKNLSAKWRDFISRFQYIIGTRCVPRVQRSPRSALAKPKNRGRQHPSRYSSKSMTFLRRSKFKVQGSPLVSPFPSFLPVKSPPPFKVQGSTVRGSRFVFGVSVHSRPPSSFSINSVCSYEIRSAKSKLSSNYF
jgi:hypothetical protein